ncbi:MAG: 30S ribosomal protein S2 [Pseudomonadota bacterium]
MTFPTFTMRQLLEAGVHFGHVTRRWNPRMAPYLYGARNGVHIIDLTQTVPMMHRALTMTRETIANNGRVLFVGTKRQAQEPVAGAAQRCGQYYVNHRWLGGMLTNWRTISHSIRKLRDIEARLGESSSGFTKKELLQLNRERDKLERALGGIKDMGGLPDLLFVIDTNKEALAIAEANTLNIPVIAVVDSNSSPEGVNYPIPGNDDASRAINLYCDLMVGAVLDGIQAEMHASGVDLGSLDEQIDDSVDDAEVAPEPVAEPVDETALAAEPEVVAEPAPEPEAAVEPPAQEIPAEEPTAVAAAEEPVDTAVAEEGEQRAVAT